MWKYANTGQPTALFCAPEFALRQEAPGAQGQIGPAREEPGLSPAPQPQYLGVVLPELVPPHVVALEHGHRAVQPRHVQAQVVRANLFVSRVRKYLEREIV